MMEGVLDGSQYRLLSVCKGCAVVVPQVSPIALLHL